MLEALYKYAQDNKLVSRPGFKAKKIKYHICFSSNGDFLGFSIVEDDAEPPMCPDIGSLANGTTKSNIIAEKAEVILNLPDKNGECKRTLKQKFYIDSMTEAGESDDRFLVAVNGLNEHMEEIRKSYSEIKKAKPADFISVKVDNFPLEKSTDYFIWWEEFRKRFDTKKKSDNVRCFITGELTEPIKTVPPVQGLISVGGHTKGDSFICFDKDAYKSYGFEQAANAAVSEEAIAAVNSALSKLLKEAPPSVAGAKYVHWFSEKTEYDVFKMFDFGFNESVIENDSSEQISEDEHRVREMFSFMKKRSLPHMPQNRYYMMALSGVNGRVMIRSYDEGTYNELCSNIRAWYEDLAIDEPRYGKRYFKLFYTYSRLLKYSTDNKKLSERIEKELSGLAPKIMYAIMHNTVLPDTVAAKALAYIRSDMYGGNEERKTAPIPDIAACQILKAWLNRKYRKEKKEELIIMEKLNKESPSAAYQTGRLMAVYAAIQAAALGDVGAGVVERYYTSACTSPALVMGKLATMAQYHLSKLKGEQQGLYVFFSRQLEEISCKIGTSLPKTFSLNEQSEFALGYYFQRAERSASKKMEE